MLSLPEQGSNMPIHAKHHSRAATYAVLKRTSLCPAQGDVETSQELSINPNTRACPAGHEIIRKSDVFEQALATRRI